MWVNFDNFEKTGSADAFDEPDLDTFIETLTVGINKDSLYPQNVLFSYLYVRSFNFILTCLWDLRFNRLASQFKSII